MSLDFTNLIDFTTPETDFGLTESATIFPVEMQPIMAFKDQEDAETEYSFQAPNHSAIVNTDSAEIVGIVSSNYGLMTNYTYFCAAEEAMLETIPTDMQRDVQVRETTNGSWSKREYVFPAYAEVLKNTVHETQVGLRVIASNSYDGSQSARMTVGLIDFYCTNGMIVGRGIEQGARRHTSKITPADLIPSLREGIKNAQDMVGEVQQMIDTPIREDDVIAVLENSFSGARAAELLTRFHAETEQRGFNVFALHSAMTHYASHQDEYRSRGDWNPRHLDGREQEVFKATRSKEFRQLLEVA